MANAGRAGTSFLSVHEPAESFRVKVHVTGSSSVEEALAQQIAGFGQNHMDYEKTLFDEAGAFIAKSCRAWDMRLRIAIQAKQDFSSLTELVVAGLKVSSSYLYTRAPILMLQCPKQAEH